MVFSHLAGCFFHRQHVLGFFSPPSVFFHPANCPGCFFHRETVAFFSAGVFFFHREIVAVFFTRSGTSWLWRSFGEKGRKRDSSKALGHQRPQNVLSTQGIYPGTRGRSGKARKTWKRGLGHQGPHNVPPMRGISPGTRGAWQGTKNMEKGP